MIRQIARVYRASVPGLRQLSQDRSSDEVGDVGNVKDDRIGIGTQSMTRDFDDERVVRIGTDSRVSTIITSGLGLDKSVVSIRSSYDYNIICDVR